MEPKTTAMYGYSPKLAPFRTKTPDEQVALLRSWGNTVVFGGYQDPAFVDAVHRAGMPVYAEFGCFADEQQWTDHPESRPVTETGAPLERDGWYTGVNPSTPAVRQERLRALEELLTRHEIDGVWLDFIRWPCHWESPAPRLYRTSFDADTLSRFADEVGIQLVQRDVPSMVRLIRNRHQHVWSAWRIDQITSFVAQARELVRQIRPQALLGLFGVPWRIEDYDGAIRTIIGQDYTALGAHVDVFSPMVYHRMCGRSPEWIAEVTEEVRALSGKPVWPIIQAVDEPTALPAEEYGRALDVALGCSAADGVLVFTLEAALAEDKLAATVARWPRRAG